MCEHEEEMGFDLADALKEPRGSERTSRWEHCPSLPAEWLGGGPAAMTDGCSWTCFLRGAGFPRGTTASGWLDILSSVVVKVTASTGDAERPRVI